MTLGYIVLALIVVIAAYFIFVYNGLVRNKNLVAEGWSGIDVQLKRRADLIPNLVETVKGYATHEKEVLEGVVEARAKATQVTVSADTLSDPEKFKQFQDSQSGLTASLGKLLAVVENYPDLKANQNFLSLQGELADIENKIAAARRFFNNAVSEYNTAIQSVPAVFFAASMGFKPSGFFELPEPERAAVQQAPSVKF